MLSVASTRTCPLCTTGPKSSAIITAPGEKCGLGPDAKPEDEALADAMARYWVQFAKSGHPNVDGLAEWPAYEPSTDRHLELGDVIKVGSHYRRTPSIRSTPSEPRVCRRAIDRGTKGESSYERPSEVPPQTKRGMFGSSWRRDVDRCCGMWNLVPFAPTASEL